MKRRSQSVLSSSVLAPTPPSHKRSRKSVPKSFQEQYELGTQLGRGAFSTVFSVRNRDTGVEAVVKIIPKNVAAAPSQHEGEGHEGGSEGKEGKRNGGGGDDAGTSEAEVRDEVRVLRRMQPRCRDEHGLCLIDFLEDANNYYIVTELLQNKQSLQQLLVQARTDRNLRSSMQKSLDLLVCNMASALQWLHAQGVAHRDIKPDNLMVDRHSWDVAFIDFGFACDAEMPSCNMWSNWGTPDYKAPEVHVRSKSRAYNLGQYQRSDWWSMGMTILTLLANTAVAPAAAPSSSSSTTRFLPPPTRTLRTRRPAPREQPYAQEAEERGAADDNDDVNFIDWWRTTLGQKKNRGDEVAIGVYLNQRTPAVIPWRAFLGSRGVGQVSPALADALDHMLSKDPLTRGLTQALQALCESRDSFIHDDAAFQRLRAVLVSAREPSPS